MPEEDDPAGGEDCGPPGRDVMGQIVVEMAIVDVMTVVDRAGQFVTSGPQLVIVISLVVNTVDVVNNAEVFEKLAGKLVVADARVELGIELCDVDTTVKTVDELVLGEVTELVAGTVWLVLLVVVIKELELLPSTELVVEVEAIVAIVRLLALLGMLLVEEAIGTVDTDVEAD